MPRAVNHSMCTFFSSPSVLLSYLCSIHVFSAATLLLSLSSYVVHLRGRIELLQSTPCGVCLPGSRQLTWAPLGFALGLCFMTVPCDDNGSDQSIRPPEHHILHDDRLAQLPDKLWPLSLLLRQESFLSGKPLCLLPTNAHYFPCLDVRAPNDWILEWTVS